jgi:hypothetical protein
LKNILLDISYPDETSFRKENKGSAAAFLHQKGEKSYFG